MHPQEPIFLACVNFIKCQASNPTPRPHPFFICMHAFIVAQMIWRVDPLGFIFIIILISGLYYIVY